MVALVVALVAAMGALLVLAYDANPAKAAGDCSTSSGTTTCTFSSTGEEDTFVVPAGVSSVRVVATGAPGAEGIVRTQGGSPAAGGRGAVVSGNLTGLETGDTLYINVGGAPTGAGTNDCPEGALAPNAYDCIGGFNGGGSSRPGGGGGGGASDVRYLSRDRSGSLASRLIVAAGGGGGGIGGTCMQIRAIPNPTQPLLGGTGGAAGSDGSDGAACNTQLGGDTYTLTGGKGGKAGTQSAGGAGGAGGTDPDDGHTTSGTSGSLGQGGGGGLVGGAGGGGGLFGGGGGGAGKVCGHSEDCQSSISAAGGGGGGSNLVPQGGSATLTQNTSVPPSVTISYRSGLVGEPPPTEQPQSKAECKKGGYEEFGFKNQGRCIKAVNHPR